MLNKFLFYNCTIKYSTSTFHRRTFPPVTSCVSDNIVVISKALTNQFVIPEFNTFSDIIDTIFDKCKTNTKGMVRYLVMFIPNMFNDTPVFM